MAVGSPCGFHPECCRRPPLNQVCTLPPPPEGTTAPKTMQTLRLRQRGELWSWRAPTPREPETSEAKAEERKAHRLWHRSTRLHNRDSVE